MSDLFLYYQAHRKDGHIRTNNAVFTTTGPIATIDDIRALEADIMRLYEYEDCRIMFWQRMEETTRIEGENT